MVPGVPAGPSPSDHERVNFRSKFIVEAQSIVPLLFFAWSRQFEKKNLPAVERFLDGTTPHREAALVRQAYLDSAISLLK